MEVTCLCTCQRCIRCWMMYCRFRCHLFSSFFPSIDRGYCYYHCYQNRNILLAWTLVAFSSLPPGMSTTSQLEEKPIGGEESSCLCWYVHRLMMHPNLSRSKSIKSLGASSIECERFLETALTIRTAMRLNTCGWDRHPTPR